MAKDMNDMQMETHILANFKMVKPMGKDIILGIIMKKFTMENGLEE